MKAEISTIGLLHNTSYTGVYQQQGRMFVDRDWNDFCDALLRQVQSAVDLSVGSGAPRHGGAIEFKDDSLQLRNAGGTVAADGLVASLRPRGATGGEQPLYGNQADLPDMLESKPLQSGPIPGDAVAYVDIWDRTVLAFEDASLRDPALHGADTTFRTQRMAQIKLATVADILKESDPCNPQFDPNRVPACGNAKFDISMEVAAEDADNCDPCAISVEMESVVPNELFRLEVHSVTYEKRNPVGLVLKWSTENGAREFTKDEAGSLPQGYAYEYFSTDTEKLLGMASDDWHPGLRFSGVMDPPNPVNALKDLPRIRQWDGWVALRFNGGKWELDTSRPARHAGTDNNTSGFRASIDQDDLHLRLPNRKLTLLVSLALQDRHFLQGDFWLALGRSRAPAEDGKRYQALSNLPIGVMHHYLVLGPVIFKEGVLMLPEATPHDQRRLQHPSLTCLDARDVGYDPKGCAYLGGTTNVEQALDKLCARNHLVLMMSAGTGQEGRTGETLPTPLTAIVLDQDGKPAQNVPVTFTATGGDLLAKTSPPSVQPQQTVNTNAAGQVQVRWQINGAEGAHEVTAKLANSQSVITYGAKLLPPPRPTLPVLKALYWDKDKKPFLNDTSIADTTLTAGLVFEFSESLVSAEAVQNGNLRLVAETVIDRFEIPYLAMDFIICGRCETMDNKVTFYPDALSIGEIIRLASTKTAPCAPKIGIRFRIRLLGRFVEFANGQLLDGYVPSHLNGSTIELNFNNPGLGQVSDFEAWFYVFKDKTIKHEPVDPGISVFPVLISGKEVKVEEKAVREFLAKRGMKVDRATEIAEALKNVRALDKMNGLAIAMTKEELDTLGDILSKLP